MAGSTTTAEAKRLEEATGRSVHWKRWGPYLSERQWGTVREDYSENGTAWDYFPHDHARSRAYRWGEDGILGISDNHQRLCFALAMWNGRDPILKERMFGLTGSEGNHGEDVKEYFFFLDSTPTHSYMKGLYKYPQSEFPYAWLVDENRRRGRHEAEFELLDSGIFEENRYFDVVAEYAKATPSDILIKISVTNRGPDPAMLHLLPTLWFRNAWSWDVGTERPRLRGARRPDGTGVITVENKALPGAYRLFVENAPELLFTENETNQRRLYGTENTDLYVKDGFHDYVIHGKKGAVNPEPEGSKAAANFVLDVPAGKTVTVRLRLVDGDQKTPFADFDKTFEQRRKDADEFYATVIPDKLSDDSRLVMRQAIAGMLWCKQWYHYDVTRWLHGDPTGPTPPARRLHGRNRDWTHLYNDDVVSMPDSWEYPWYAAWDLAFHCVALAHLDAEFAKSQLILLCREWFMHPNGQLPAYEWAFGDVNPPVHAWAALRVFHIDGGTDFDFLERVFHKLLLNFTWWVNRKDAEGNNVFQGGFLGLDNVGPFDRSAALPFAGHLEQSDGTAWMAMYCLSLLQVALILAEHDPTYEDVATKFFEHFTLIAIATHEQGLWDDEDGFYYDVLHFLDGRRQPLKARSIVGLIPQLAVTVLPDHVRRQLPDFSRRMDFYLHSRPELHRVVDHVHLPGEQDSYLLSVVKPDQLRRVLTRMLDEQEFLSPHGLRSLSRFHRDHPLEVELGAGVAVLDYEPAESTSGLFGGNSNWRGPIWMPINYLVLGALRRFHAYLGDDFRVECPTGSGRMLNLLEVSAELGRRLVALFADDAGRRPVLGCCELFQRDPAWHDLVPFHEYFDGDTGAGLGASHQTGWTGLVGAIIAESVQHADDGSLGS